MHYQPFKDKMREQSALDVKRRLYHREISQLATQIQNTDENNPLYKKLTNRFNHLRHVISNMDKQNVQTQGNTR